MPSVLVVDASVVAAALADDATDGDRARARLSCETLAAPGLIDLEVTSGLRGWLAGGHLDVRRARLALMDLLDLPLQRVPGRILIQRCCGLRDDLTVYDAAYVALAEALDAPLPTADTRLAKASGTGCHIEALR